MATKKTTKRTPTTTTPAPPRLLTIWMIDRPKARPAVGAARVVPFVSADGSGACAWASRREAIEAAEQEQGAAWRELARLGWQVRRVTGIASEIAR